MRGRYSFIAVLCFVVFGLGTSFSQILAVRSTDVFVGYNYTNYDLKAAGRQSFNGWTTSSSINFNRTFAVEGDVTGSYTGSVLNSHVSASDYTFTAGPRVNFKPFFVHALFGDDRLSSLGHSDNAFAMIFGGGIQHKLTGNLSARASVDYVGARHFDVQENNVRVGGGVVYTFHQKGSAK
jgi:opacity protein-like surface antigen